MDQGNVATERVRELVDASIPLTANLASEVFPSDLILGLCGKQMGHTCVEWGHW